jgi:general secretion pathway protein D
VITNSVTPLVTGGAVTTGSVQYLDIGLKLEVEPDIHLDNEVVIKVSLDVSSIIREVQNAQSGTLAYEVGTRNAATVLRLRDGETQILAGLINDEDRKTASKIPGLGQIPMLGRLFSSHKDDGKKTEIVLSITPHMVGSAHLPDADEMEYWAGTESTVRSGLVGGKPLGSVTLGTAAAPASPALQPRTLLPAINSPAPLTAINAAPMALSWQGPTQAKVGDIINVTLNAQTAQALNGLDVQLRFDPAVFKMLDVSEGSFLKQKNIQSGFDKTIDAASGQVQLNLNGAEGVSGSGSIATLVLQVLAARAPAQISLSQVTPTGSGGEAQAVGALPPFSLTVLP